MTLLELCDQLGATLIIKRVPKKDKIVYSVNIQRARLYKKRMHSLYVAKEYALVCHSDVNKALYALCSKVSGKYIELRGKELSVGKVEKGSLSILGDGKYDIIRVV